jgi:hypothetical protein
MRTLHLRTADRGVDDAIAAWLRRHDVEVIECADAFDACVAALESPQTAPDILIAGVDWLSPSESSVLGYLRETWPGIIMLIHGGSNAAAVYPAAARTLICRTDAELRQVLASPPAALRDHLKESKRIPENSDDQTRTPPRISISELPPVGEPQSPDNPERSEAPERQAPPVDRPVATPAAAPKPHAAPARVTSLTAEELAALLEDWEPNIDRSADV